MEAEKVPCYWDCEGEMARQEGSNVFVCNLCGQFATMKQLSLPTEARSDDFIEMMGLRCECGGVFNTKSFDEPTHFICQSCGLEEVKPEWAPRKHSWKRRES